MHQSDIGLTVFFVKSRLRGIPPEVLRNKRSWSNTAPNILSLRLIIYQVGYISWRGKQITQRAGGRHCEMACSVSGSRSVVCRRIVTASRPIGHLAPRSTRRVEHAVIVCCNTQETRHRQKWYTELNRDSNQLRVGLSWFLRRAELYYQCYAIQTNFLWALLTSLLQFDYR